MNSTTKNLKDTLDSTANAAHDAVSATATHSKNAVDAVDTFGANASAKVTKTLEAARDLAGETIEDTRDSLSRSGDRLTETLRRVAEGPSENSIPGRMMSAVSHGVTSVAETFQDRNLSDIAADVRALARRNPGVVAVGAAVAGFALARFLRSSMRHHRDPQSIAGAAIADGARHSLRGKKTDPSRS